MCRYFNLNIIQNIIIFNILDSSQKESNLLNQIYENVCTLNKEEISLASVMNIEMCNDFYKKKSLNKLNNTFEVFPKNIKDIFTDMYVDEMFVSVCEHMVELCGKLSTLKYKHKLFFYYYI